MNIDINHLEANIRRFHKSATSLAMQASGVETEQELTFYPVVVGDSPKFIAITCGKADSDFYTRNNSGHP